MQTGDKDHILIVGAGQAGGRAAQALRREGFQGRITLIGEEQEAPYERPPLSKDVLRGERPPSAGALFNPDFFAENAITLVTGVRVDGIEPSDGRALLGNGERLAYDKLLLCTGGRVRTLPFAPIGRAGVYYLRTATDALALSQAIWSARRLVIIGGGYLALEAAASAKSLGIEVTIIEMAPNLLARALATDIASYVMDIHRRRGVEFYFGATATEIIGEHKVEAVELADGTRLPADIVLVAIGIVPQVELAAHAGARIEDGIWIDDCGKTTIEGVYATGDVANFHNPTLNQRMRLESWQNAQNQPAAIASAICGKPRLYSEVPWFWSDQYEFNIQSVGAPQHTDTIVARGDPTTGRFGCFNLANDALVGATGFNTPGDVRWARKMIAANAQPDIRALADPTIKLKFP
jgi:3-phenylpropionate/trans-cinnamate dioxygenase ferredoxin reductase subunit